MVAFFALPLRVVPSGTSKKLMCARAKIGRRCCRRRRRMHTIVVGRTQNTGNERRCILDAGNDVNRRVCVCVCGRRVHLRIILTVFHICLVPHYHRDIIVG